MRNSLQEAINSVDNAVNNTLTHLRDRSRTHTVQDLLQLVRYPSPTALSLARAAEVFEQTLELIHNHVRNGHNYNTHGHGENAALCWGADLLYKIANVIQGFHIHVWAVCGKAFSKLQVVMGFP